MKHKTLMAVTVCVGAAVFFTGCEQPKEKERIMESELQNVRAGNGDGRGEMNGRGKNDEYIVDQSDHVRPHILLNDIAISDLNDVERDGLIYMREEEKLARDVYMTLYNKWELPIFKNIADSEQTHTDTIKFLLDKYGIKDPVTDDTIGVFASTEMQALYDGLVADGSASPLVALIVGATVEDLDIRDLRERVAQTDNADISIAYENLMRGSRNHLRAFVRQIERNEGVYEPQYISTEEYMEIIADTQEKGGGARDGSGERASGVW